MEKTSHTRKLHGAVVILVAAAIASTLLARVSAGRFEPYKDCVITDDNGREWPCSRALDHTANVTKFTCPVENRLGAPIHFNCHDQVFDFDVGPGEAVAQVYDSIFDPAPPHYPFVVQRTSPKVSCEWKCAGNTMEDVVVWDERWPEAWSCRDKGGDGHCRLVFESNREVVLVTRAGRRVLGDVAIKECGKKWSGYARWLPFGLGCTYPKHDHNYYGSIGWVGAGRGR